MTTKGIEAKHNTAIECVKGARSMFFGEVYTHPAQFSSVQPLRLHNSPALVIAGCFALGILFRNWWQPPMHVLLTCVLLLVVAASAVARAPRMAWFATAVAFIALGWATVLLRPSTQNASLIPYADTLQRKVEAVVTNSRMISTSVASKPDDDAWEEEEAEGNAREVLQLNALRAEEITPDISVMRPVSGGIQATLSSHNAIQDVPYLPCGTHVELTLRMHPQDRFRDPDIWNYADRLQDAGIIIAATADVKQLRVLPPSSISFRCWFQRAQHWSSDRITLLTISPWMRYLPYVMQWNATDASMLRAMLFGDRTALQRNVRMAFERTGSFHLFVVAGVHIAILMAVFYQFFLRLRMAPWGAALCTLLGVSGYAVLTGFGEPVRRALFMSTIYLLAMVLDRERQVMNALGIAILGMLCLDPNALFEASLQMTVLSVFAVGGIALPLVSRTLGPCADALKYIEHTHLDVHYAPYLAQLRIACRVAGRLFTGWLPKRYGMPIAQRVPAWLLRIILVVSEAILSILMAELVMTLPMMVYFHRLTPFAAPANLLALPLIGFVMGCAMTTFLLSLLHPLLALIPAAMTALSLHGIGYVVRTLNASHGADMRAPSPLPACIAAACLLWLLAILLLHEHRRRSAWIGCVLTVAAFVVLLLPSRPAFAGDALSFTSIDVGQGDSEFVTTPEGKVMVIDAGGPMGSRTQNTTSNFDIGEEIVSPMLWRQRIRTIDVLVVTHAHSDHIGGALAVLRNFHPRELWISVDAASPLLQDLVEEAGADNVSVRRMHLGDTAQLGSVSITAESPVPGYQNGNEPANDDSLVLRLQYGKSSVLVAGDAERASEEAMLRHGLPTSTLLKVGHHGSNTSTSEEFLQQLQSQCAVISCGRGNPFGHPRMQVLQRLQGAHVKTARTDTMGAIRYLLHADGSINMSALMSER
ncbi:ComEC/Rec2 family competence protein [Terriglobus sp. TAA 43]|uniref:ComEC/Rec2 family competence protein n=1 Tax=Terriglobus sp. TAA 43 TaxID=278961 RepID=UPI00068BB0F7|nr:ComEC/Rec2 family competence protein [Terriglobus sp. TAA 43]